MKRIHVVLIGIVFFLVAALNASATKSLELAQKFAQVLKLARITANPGLTVLPRSRLQESGGLFLDEINFLDTTMKSVGMERILQELPNSTATRMIRNAGEEWDARYERSDESTRKLARDANHNINRICELYEEIISRK
ncbi:MAG: hypothetical protein HON43_00400 [Alphaproteobacteria bacterium]|jgi:hypothetical protein|nr:hypothetical protein [Alphaproteobacteria bacterium]MBT5389472.1 hypothetical protein [Alphaproteobacteria bacterium]